MKLSEFYQRVQADDWIHGADVVFSDKHKDLDHVKLNVDHKRKLRRWETVELIVSTITNPEIDWPRLREVIMGRGNPNPITHVTRIVGYFSVIERWNKSKIGELMDRRKGDYMIGTVEELDGKFDARVFSRPKGTEKLDLTSSSRKRVE